MKAGFALLPLLVLVVACSGEAPASTPTGTATDPLAAAIADAAGKKVLVMYRSETCACCTRMDEEALVDPEVKETLAKMAFLRVTKGEDAATFESRWPETGTPSFVVLGPDGKALGDPQRGPFDAGEFLYLLDWIVEGEGPQPQIVRIAEGCGGACGDAAAEAEAGAETDGCGGCSEE